MTRTRQKRIGGGESARRRTDEISGAMVREMCDGCGMKKEDWSNKTGLRKGTEIYCCEGCAEGTGCVCGR